MTNEEMAVKLTEVDARSKSNTHRINELAQEKEAIHRIATAVEVMVREQQHQTEKMGELKQEIKEDIADIKEDVSAVNTKVETLDAKVDAVEQRPQKKLAIFVEKFGLAIVGALAGALVTLMFAFLFGASV